MLNRNVNSIIYKSYIRIGDLALELATNATDLGLEGNIEQRKLWRQAISLYSFLLVIEDNIVVKNNQVYQLRGVTEQEMNKFLVMMDELSGATDYPVAPFIPTNEVTQIIVGGSQGSPGTNGTSSYISVVYAEDTNGTGISSTPSPLKFYFAIKTSTSPITLDPANFTGLWQKIAYEPFDRFTNNDVDTGTEDVDSFPVGDATSAKWECTIVKGTNRKIVTIEATWDGVNPPQVGESNVQSIGTIDITLDVVFSGGLIKLQATATSNDWRVSGIRTQID